MPDEVDQKIQPSPTSVVEDSPGQTGSRQKQNLLFSFWQLCCKRQSDLHLNLLFILVAYNLTVWKSQRQMKSEASSSKSQKKNNEESERKSKNSGAKSWYLFAVPLSTYLAFSLIIVASFFLFKPANNLFQSKNNQAEQGFTKEQKDQIVVEVKKEIERISRQEETSPQVKAFLENPDSLVAMGYIDGKIQKEAQDQAEKVATDEINKLKADWKGELFGQISFPVIFAVASIFAAFAVKDILTEILKEEKIKELEKQIETKVSNLEEKIKPEINASLQNYFRKEIDRKLKIIHSSLDWLEYETASLANQTLISKTTDLEEVIEVIEKCKTRTSSILRRLEMTDLEHQDKIKLLFQYENATLGEAVSKLTSNTKDREKLFQVICKSTEESGDFDNPISSQISVEDILRVKITRFRLLLPELVSLNFIDKEKEKSLRQEILKLDNELISRQQIDETAKKYSTPKAQW